MKILITGNMGYVGPGVVKQLLESNHQLTGFDIGYFSHCLTGATYFPEVKLRSQLFGDIREFPYEVLDQFDAIIHLAALSNDPIGSRFEAVTEQINYDAGLKLANEAKHRGIKRFIFASSCSMYGFGGESAKKENDSLNPLTAYAKSKVHMEQALAELADKDFLATSLRFSTACGMSPRLRLDLVLNDFVACALSSGQITVLSDGSPWRPLIDVKDMALAIDWALNREADCGGECLAVNVGSNQWNYQVRDLADAVSRLIPDTEVSINTDAPHDKRSYKVNFSLYESLAPSHQPRVNLEQSILELKQGLETIHFQDSHFRSSEFMRLKVIENSIERKILNEKLQRI